MNNAVVTTVEVDLPEGSPSAYSLGILNGLQSKPVYAGTVPAHVKARRRARNKVARLSRKANR